MITQKLSNGSIVNNRYHIQCILGQGGFGCTYLATDQQRYNEYCTLKEFSPHPQNFRQLQKSQELFQREAATLYKLNHPQIPSFIAEFNEYGRHFVVQQYIEGNTYQTLLNQKLQQKQTFSEAEVVKFLKEILPVLDYIHNHNILHRDISPDNIIQPLNPTKPVVLIDFGVVGYLEGATSVGKTGYAAPEQMGGGQSLPSSDLYSLAVTAIELLTGKAPDLLFDSYHLKWQWQRHTNVSRKLSNILNKMLQSSPRNRYQSASEVMMAMGSLESTASIKTLFTLVSTLISIIGIFTLYTQNFCFLSNSCKAENIPVKAEKLPHNNLNFDTQNSMQQAPIERIENGNDSKDLPLCQDVSFGRCTE